MRIRLPGGASAAAVLPSARTADGLAPAASSMSTHTFTRPRSDAAGHAYRYDPNGRLVAREGPEGTLRLWFDDRDRLVRAHTPDDRLVHHRYDALGRRVDKKGAVEASSRRTSLGSSNPSPSREPLAIKVHYGDGTPPESLRPRARRGVTYA